ncbi:PREDICTED: uncharacterized protein LOC100641058 [Paramuricea clavata]|uniref:PREDICTED: uncharacterized protein LOC100641058 n=1 Tax=Paramuricea clavata TaxID=317549 RepID=A0A6S7H0M5_PARCT|nr:PREDICTED: uncharacterized protein LOC100641058 [Paramuricea clavata]
MTTYSTESETEAESETNDENEVQTSFPTTSKSSCRKFTGAARYKSTFQNEWTVKYKTFLRQVHGNIHAFYCNVCNDVIRHKDGEDHKRWESSLRNQPILNLATSSTNTLLFNTSKAEVLAAKFIVEHNLPISVSDHLGPLFRQMFPDSTIAKNYASAHTKTNCIINDAIAPPMQQELVSQMKNGPFSLAIDGSSDNELEKMNPLTVRLFDINTHKVEGRFLDMCSATASTAQAIYDKMNEVLNKHDIPWDYCVGMSVDNTSVNVGRHNSIKTRVEDANDTVYFMGCPCHILHNTAFYGGKAFEEIVNFSADDLCGDIFYWFEHSSKRKNLLSDLCDFCDVQYRQVIKHVSTRWLSLESAVERVLKAVQPSQILLFVQYRAASKIQEIEKVIPRPNDRNLLVFLPSCATQFYVF